MGVSQIDVDKGVSNRYLLLRYILNLRRGVGIKNHVGGRGREAVRGCYKRRWKYQDYRKLVVG